MLLEIHKNTNLPKILISQITQFLYLNISHIMIVITIIIVIAIVIIIIVIVIMRRFGRERIVVRTCSLFAIWLRIQSLMFESWSKKKIKKIDELKSGLILQDLGKLVFF